MADVDLNNAEKFIALALATLKGFDVPLAAWRVHATASRLCELTGNRLSAMAHRSQSRTTILRLADSLPEEEGLLRATFLSAPPIARILAGDPSSVARDVSQIFESKEFYS
jgi:hypothetical protein